MVITTLSTNDHSQWEWITRSQQKTQGGRMTKKTRPLHMRVCVYDTHTDGKQRDGKIYSIEMQTQAAGLAVRTPDKTDFQAKAETGEKRASRYLPEETQTRLPRDKRARTLVAVSSTTAEVGRRPVCPPIDGELKKRWSLRTMERDPATEGRNSRRLQRQGPTRSIPCRAERVGQRKANAV